MVDDAAAQRASSAAAQSDLARTAHTYRDWALVESAGLSPTYERLALAIADHRPALELLQKVHRPRRQPNLLLGALRWYGVDVSDPAAALAWLDEHRAQALEVLRTRRTQTNEAARCALLLPSLAQLAQRSRGPLAVVEVGASAGLCLLLDAWRYRYTMLPPDDASDTSDTSDTGDTSDTSDTGCSGVLGDADDEPGSARPVSTPSSVSTRHDVGPADSPVTLTCAVSGPAPLPTAVPPIAWRAGLDLHPVDPSDPDARRWLQALVWPEHVERAERLGAALDMAVQARPDVRAGDMTTDLAPLLDEARSAAEALAPGDGPATVVVTHTAAMVYLAPDDRDCVRRVIAGAGAHRLGGEHAGVMPDVDARVPDASRVGGRMVVSPDDVPLALADPHGAALHWF